MVEALARALLDHRDAGRPRAVDGTIPNVAAAYAVQTAGTRILVEERGWQPIGYKIAATNAASCEIVGTDTPLFGRLYVQVTDPSGVRLDGVGRFFHVHEPEIALRLGHTLDPGAAPFDAAAIEAATAAVLPAIEIISTVFEPWREAGACNLIADNAAHGHWITGDAVTDWSALDLLDGGIEVFVDGARVAEGCGQNVDGGPFGATAWLANALAAEGRGLRAGEFVTTGTTTPPIPISGDGTVRADFGALGHVEFTLQNGDRAS